MVSVVLTSLPYLIESIVDSREDDGTKARYSPKFIWVSPGELTNWFHLKSNYNNKDDTEVVESSNYKDEDGRPYLTTRRLYRKHAGLRARVASVLVGRVVA